MKASKKLMSLLLVVAMLVCAIPFQVFAEDVDPNTTPVTVPVKVAIEGGKTYDKTITVSADSAVVLTEEYAMSTSGLVSKPEEKDFSGWFNPDGDEVTGNELPYAWVKNEVENNGYFLTLKLTPKTAPTEPKPTEPKPTEPKPTEPTETEPVLITKITLMKGDKVFSVVPVEEGKAIELPTPEVSKGQYFKGWYSEPNGKGERIYSGLSWISAKYQDTYYAYITEDPIDTDTVRVFVKYYVGGVLRETKEIDSIALPTGANAFDWLYNNKDRVDALIQKAYGDDYVWNPRYYYNHTGKELLTEQNLVANGSQSIVVKVKSATKADVLLCVHSKKATATPVIYEMDGFKKGDTVRQEDVTTLLKKYYKSPKYEGLYAEDAFQDLLDGKKPMQANSVTVDSNGTVKIHVVLLSGTASSTADSTNPKTGDYILDTAMTMMAISGLAAAAVYVVGKKRRV